MRIINNYHLENVGFVRRLVQRPGGSETDPRH